jgi:malto-oligosyltrehalose trehalohydrolase
MTRGFSCHLTFGAEPVAEGRARFRLWAPSREGVALELGEGSRVPMAAREDGWFEIETDAAPGTAYRFRLAPDDLAVPDPAARLQAEDVPLGRSLLVDPDAYRWRCPDWRGRPWRETVLYECHAGALGGFRGVAERIPHLAALGVTALELMPIADFPGRRNWGYDGVLLYAPDAAYGTPDDLKSLVDTAHEHGLMIFLDVVYNHFGPVGNYLHAYAKPFFREDLSTPWGSAIDFRRKEVRDFFVENAIYWLEEYRFDGLRFDAVHAIADPDILIELSERVRAAAEPGRHIHLVLENDANIVRYLDGHFDAQWNDDAHHVLHVLLTGEYEGYYEDYTEEPAEKLARCLASGFVYQGESSPHRGGQPRGEPSGHLPPTRFVHFLQNHDQIGNRAFGERLSVLANPRGIEAATALLLLAPQIPMLFMGEEWGARTPFLYFTDHDGELAEAVREGRQREFASFRAFKDPARRALIPDPNEAETFSSSRPDFSEMERPEGAGRLSYIRSLLAIRHREIVPHLDGARSEGAEAVGTAAVVARWRLGNGALLALHVNLAASPTFVANVAEGDLLFEAHPGDWDTLRGGKLAPFSLVALLRNPA